MKHSILRNSKVIKFIIAITIIGFLIGIIFYLNLSSNTKESIIKSLTNINTNLKETHQNNIIFHLFIISIFILSSLTFILYPLTLFYIFYEILSFGFILAYYTSNFALGGLLYAIIYFFLNKALFMLILMYISFTSFKLIKKIIKSIILKDNIGVGELYKNYFYKLLISTSFIFIFDIIIYFFGNKILSLFQFLL